MQNQNSRDLEENKKELENKPKKVIDNFIKSENKLDEDLFAQKTIERNEFKYDFWYH
jgi:hypothetical protein